MFKNLDFVNDHVKKGNELLEKNEMLSIEVLDKINSTSDDVIERACNLFAYGYFIGRSHNRLSLEEDVVKIEGGLIILNMIKMAMITDGGQYPAKSIEYSLTFLEDHLMTSLKSVKKELLLD
ncbi:MAG: hypothetical protein IJ359_02290 [Erysipelotrichaceae bacterium]|nr:hypothetical protein [Erysipelotrichaceae bacterium]